MANLQSYAVLSERVKKYQSDYSLDTPGVAFAYISLEVILNLNSDEIDEALVDDSMDGGVDAIHIIDNDIHIFSFHYASTFENAAKKFPQNKLDSLIITTQNIFTKEITKKDVNQALWEKVQEIWDVAKKGIPKLHFYVCSNKEKPDEAAVRRFETSLKQFNFVEFKYLNLETIVLMILQKKHRLVNGKVTFIGRDYFMKSDGPLKSTVATIAATDLVTLISDPDDSTKINEDAFNENVRVDLGLKNAINMGIWESALAKNNYEFWYLNNGITMVCEECKYLPNSVSPMVDLTNVQIVNGGQTTRTLFHAYQKAPDMVRNVYLLARIIETKDRSISEKISETANKQTPVRTRDLHANDWIQRKLEDEFRTNGYYYERKKNQFSDKARAFRLDSEQLGQVALAFYLDMPSEAKNSKSLIFGDKYQDIFDEESVTALKLLFPWKLYKPLEEKKREIQNRKRKGIRVTYKETFIPLATFHILNAMKFIAKKECLNLSEETEASSARRKATQSVLEVVGIEKKLRGKLYAHDHFFKESGTNKKIHDHILGDSS